MEKRIGRLRPMRFPIVSMYPHELGVELDGAAMAIEQGLIPSLFEQLQRLADC